MGKRTLYKHVLQRLGRAAALIAALAVCLTVAVATGAQPAYAYVGDDVPLHNLPSRPEGADDWRGDGFEGWIVRTVDGYTVHEDVILTMAYDSSGNLEIPNTIHAEVYPGGETACNPEDVYTTDLEITTIAGEAFLDNEDLTSVKLPDSLIRMGHRTFDGCTNLKEVYFSGEELAYIPDACFANCTALTSFTIPSTVVQIGYRAFDGCTSLATATIMTDSPQLYFIRAAAFRGCSALTEITIPYTVRQIDFEAFKGCSSLANVYFKYADLSVLEYLGNEAFSGCSAIKELELPFAYKGSGEVIDGSQYRSLIGDHVFYGCTALEKVGLRNIPMPEHNPRANDSFSQCTNLQFVIVKIDSFDDLANYSLGLPNDAICLLVKRAQNSKDNLEIMKIYTDASFGANTANGSVDLVVPSGFITYTFTKIDRCAAFTPYNYGGAEYPYSEHSFGQNGLRSVSFEEGCQITEIGEYAFMRCRYLESITLPPSVKTIGQMAFMECDRLASVDFQTTQIAEIPFQCFRASGLKSITLPEGVQRINGQAFSHCEKLGEVHFPKSLSAIYDTAFMQCEEAIAFYMPDTGNEGGVEHAISFLRDDGGSGHYVTETGYFWDAPNFNRDSVYMVTCGSWFEQMIVIEKDLLGGHVFYIPVDISEDSPSVVINLDTSNPPVYDSTPKAPVIANTSTRWYHTMTMDDFEIDYARSSCTNAGTATAVLTGKGDKFKGERTVTFSIEKCPFDERLYIHEIEIPEGGFYWDDLQWRPEVRAIYCSDLYYDSTGLRDYRLTEDTDYTISYGTNTDAGGGALSITVNAVDTGNFTGSQTFCYDIEPRSLSDAAVAAIPDQYYTGDEVKPTPRVTLTNRNGGEIPLSVRNGDFTLGYEDNVNPGTATINIYADSSNLTGSTSATFKITSLDLDGDDIEIEIDDQTYTGSALTPEITIWNGDEELELEAGVAYSVAWEDNVNVGTARATLTGIEPYATGTATGSFDITPKTATVTPDASGKSYGDADPELTARVSGLVNNETVSYELAREEGENVGRYSITSSGTELQGNYTVTFDTGTFTIGPANISTAAVSAAGGTYDGQQHTPTPTVVWHNTLLDEDVTLEEGTDYTVRYGENIHAGQGTVTVVGKGNFTGTASGTFTIAPRPVTVTADNLGKTYADKDPHLTATVGDLIEGDSLTYTVTRAAGENVGSYTAMPSGAAEQGDYAVTYAPGTFTIGPADIADAAIAPIPEQTYAGQRLEPGLGVSYAGEAFEEDLEAGTDYEAVYDDNLAAGTASVTLTGTGNYTGENSATFTIAPKPITVTADDSTITFGELDPMLTATPEGIVDEFEPEYGFAREEGDDVGSYVIHVSGEELQGNYRISFVDGTLTIGPADIASDTVAVTEIDDQVYTGQDIEPKPYLSFEDEAFDIDPLREGRDYELSYDLNRDAGTATITVAGRGNYTGTRDVTFVITPKPITMTANDAVKTYGALDPTLTAAPAEGDIVDDFRPACEFSREEGEDVGNYTIHVSGEELQGNYRVSFVDGTLSIGPADIASATIAPIPEQTFAGQRIEPEMGVSYTGEAFEEDLEAGTDYEAVYDGNIAAGTAAVTLTGTGNYTGETSAAFTIVPKPITVTASDDGKVYGEDDPYLEATVEGVVDEFLVDYTVTRAEGEDVGSYVITAAGEADQGNYTVAFEEGTFTIKPAELTAAYAGEKIAWDGTPELAVQVSGFAFDEDAESAEGFEAPTIAAPATLEPGKSYELVPAGGLARNYTFAYEAGTLEVGLRPIDIADEPTAATGLVYNGSLQMGVPAATGFSVSGGSATDTGAYTAIATPDEGWSWADGTAEPRSISWSIAPADIADALVADVPERIYTRSAIEPGLRITFNNALLAEGTDYRVSYIDNVKVGSAGIAIVGMGNFTGSTATTFRIVGGTYVLSSAPTAPVEKGRGAEPSFTFERKNDNAGTFAFFTGIEVDGAEVDPSHYRARSGSAIITLDAAYVDSLSSGQHTLRAIFEDGNGLATFEIAANPDNPDNPDNPEVPGSGDSTAACMTLALLGGAGAVLLVAAATLRRRLR